MQATRPILITGFGIETARVRAMVLTGVTGKVIGGSSRCNEPPMSMCDPGESVKTWRGLFLSKDGSIIIQARKKSRTWYQQFMKMQYLSQKARFSRCRRYRYSLERRWRPGEKKVLFIGLNPSIADHRQDDPTIRRCVGFARDWGFAALEVVNLFAYRATYPIDLKQAADPIGQRNDRIIMAGHRQADLTVVCWGNDGAFMDRARQLSKRLLAWGDLHCLRMNHSQQPAHPLYIPAVTRPQPFIAAWL